MYLGIHRFTQIRSFSHEKYEKDIICFSSCLKVVWKLSVPEYILTLKNKGYSLSACLSTKGVLNAKPQFENTLNIFVETFFSPDIFGVTSCFFLSCVFWKRIKSFPEYITSLFKRVRHNFKTSTRTETR